MPKFNPPTGAKLGLLAGGGELPAAVCAAALAQGRTVVAVTFADQPQPLWLPQATPQITTMLPLGAVSKLIRFCQDHGVQEVVLAGYLERSQLFQLKPDWLGVKILAGALLGQDDALLQRVLAALQSAGLSVRGAHEICPELLAPTGVLTSTKPTKAQQADIALGLKLARWLGAADIGQAVIIKNGTVLGLEAVEGTNALIERCASLRGPKGRGGVLVKAAKPQQDRRVDLPTIGPTTLKLLAAHQYDGVALAAGETLLLAQADSLTFANAHKLFVVGVSDG